MHFQVLSPLFKPCIVQLGLTENNTPLDRFGRSNIYERRLLELINRFIAEPLQIPESEFPSIFDEEKNEIYISCGKKTKVYDSKGKKKGNLPLGTVSIAFDYERNLIYGTCSTGWHGMYIFRRDGSLIEMIGNPIDKKSQLDPNHFYMPAEIKIYQDKLFICDCQNDRIQVLDKSGRLLYHIAPIRSPVSIAIEADQIIVCSLQLKVTTASVDGKNIRPFSENIEGISVEIHPITKEVLITSPIGDSIEFFNIKGEYLRSVRFNGQPCYLSFHRKNGFVLVVFDNFTRIYQEL